MQNYKILLTDLDGTLLNSEYEISDKDKKSILNLKKRGVPTILCSGRPTASILKVASKLFPANEENYIISFNGGCITEISSGKKIYNKGLDIEISKKIIKIADEADITVQLYKESKFYVKSATAEAKQYKKDTKLDFDAVGDLISFLDFSSTKILLHAKHEKLLTIYPKLENVVNGKCHITFSKPHFLEIVDIDVNKGAALKKICAHLKIESNNSIAVGDSDNDREMLKVAGKGIAVANAKQELKSIADYTCKYDNNNNAISEVISTFFRQ